MTRRSRGCTAWVGWPDIGSPLEGIRRKGPVEELLEAGAVSSLM